MWPDASLPATVAAIDLAAFAHNIQVVRRLLPATCQILAVVKADAYGHGAVPLARVAQQQGVAYLGVARCPEGVVLRQHGITMPILVMGPTWPEEIATLVAHRLTICYPCQGRYGYAPLWAGARPGGRFSAPPQPLP
jgi:alanine racemase